MSTATQKGLYRLIRSLPLDWNADPYLRLTRLNKRKKQVKFHEAKIDRMADIKNLRFARSIRAMLKYSSDRNLEIAARILGDRRRFVSLTQKCREFDAGEFDLSAHSIYAIIGRVKAQFYGVDTQKKLEEARFETRRY